MAFAAETRAAAGARRDVMIPASVLIAEPVCPRAASLICVGILAMPFPKCAPVVTAIAWAINGFIQ